MRHCQPDGIAPACISRVSAPCWRRSLRNGLSSSAWTTCTGEIRTARRCSCSCSRRRSIPPFVLVAAFRTEQSTTEFRRLWREHVAAATGRIRRTCLDDRVSGLQSAAVELARSLLARHGVTNEELASALAAQSGGNPLFLEQLAADLVRSHHAGEALRPLTLTELIRDRISRLSSATREFLRFLAAFGEPLPEDLLARLVHGDERQCDGRVRYGGAKPGTPSSEERSSRSRDSELPDLRGDPRGAFPRRERQAYTSGSPRRLYRSPTPMRA